MIDCGASGLSEDRLGLAGAFSALADERITMLIAHDRDRVSRDTDQLGFVAQGAEDVLGRRGGPVITAGRSPSARRCWTRAQSEWTLQ